jgi:hypothetical protein
MITHEELQAEAHFEIEDAPEYEYCASEIEERGYAFGKLLVSRPN